MSHINADTGRAKKVSFSRFHFFLCSNAGTPVGGSLPMWGRCARVYHGTGPAWPLRRCGASLPPTSRPAVFFLQRASEGQKGPPPLEREVGEPFWLLFRLGRVLNGHSGARSATARQSEKGDPSSRGQGPRAPHPGGLGSGVGTHAYNLIVHLSYFSMRSRTGVGINMRHIPQWILHTVGYNTTEGPPPLSLSV